MGKKYRFRKMFFICEDNKVIEKNVQRCNVWQHRKDAEVIRQQNSKDTPYLWEKKAPVLKVEGFYLVHESLFDEILKDHTDQQPGD